MEDDNITVTAGDTVTLDCMVEANPANLSLLEWYLAIAIILTNYGLFWYRFHNEEVVDVTDERYEDGNTDSPSLTISQVLPEDAGQYFCQAVNQIGQARSNSVLKSSVRKLS